MHLQKINLCLLERDNSIFNKDNAKSATEHDFVGEVWVPIITAILNEDRDFRSGIGPRLINNIKKNITR
ncbi:hypothetical protein INT45_001488 [Circinella minor]|uniref:Uncharacterized protein n=1 Tax=Circinella minor TaxID=1195481 RepID=A0A8H7VSC1_9FUNG|nr:hypothetical protein INT45_001488 [Circinella minor]